MLDDTILPTDAETKVFTVFCIFAELCESSELMEDDKLYNCCTLSVILPDIDEDSSFTLCVKFNKLVSILSNLLSKDDDQLLMVYKLCDRSWFVCSKLWVTDSSRKSTDDDQLLMVYKLCDRSWFVCSKLWVAKVKRESNPPDIYAN
jgi:hypothetical protein